jgi:hypothetical protein
MTTCANCESPAELVYEVTPSFSIVYCNKHVPRSIKTNFSGALKPFVEEAPKSTKKKSEPTEEPVVEDVSVEDNGAD